MIKFLNTICLLVFSILIISLISSCTCEDITPELPEDTVPGLPDLTPLSIDSIYSSSYNDTTQSCTLYIHTTIANIGNADAGSFSIIIYADLLQSDIVHSFDLSIDQLSQGNLIQIDQIGFVYSEEICFSEFDFEISVVVDIEDEVVESDEFNNSISEPYVL